MAPPRTLERPERVAGNGLRHGHTAKSGWRSPTYTSWQAMKNRCLNPNAHRYRLYGGASPPITIDPRWLGRDGFVNFLEDMGERPEGMSLDRIDNERGYSPENCRWADAATQARNRRRREVQA